jgi:hypothetical protein
MNHLFYLIFCLLLIIGIVVFYELIFPTKQKIIENYVPANPYNIELENALDKARDKLKKDFLKKLANDDDVMENYYKEKILIENAENRLGKNYMLGRLLVSPIPDKTVHSVYSFMSGENSKLLNEFSSSDDEFYNIKK